MKELRRLAEERKAKTGELFEVAFDRVLGRSRKP
jgi:hypothetical protein